MSADWHSPDPSRVVHLITEAETHPDQVLKMKGRMAHVEAVPEN